MKSNWIKGGIAVAIIAGVMAITNPKQEDYNNYASEKLIQEGEKAICEQTGYCQDSKIPNFIKNTVLKPTIIASTQRQNLIILSLYTTEVPNVIRIKTIGAFGNFFTYSKKTI